MFILISRWAVIILVFCVVRWFVENENESETIYQFSNPRRVMCWHVYVTSLLSKCLFINKLINIYRYYLFIDVTRFHFLKPRLHKLSTLFLSRTNGRHWITPPDLHALTLLHFWSLLNQTKKSNYNLIWFDFTRLRNWFLCVKVNWNYNFVGKKKHFFPAKKTDR